MSAVVRKWLLAVTGFSPKKGDRSKFSDRLSIAVDPRYSLRLRLGLAVGGITLILSMLQSVTVSQLTTAKIEAEAGNALVELAHQITDKLDRGMFERYRDIQNIATLHTLRDYATPSEEMRSFLEKLQSTNPNYAWIGLADTLGIVQVSTGKLLEGKNISQQPWFLKGQKLPDVADLHKTVLLPKLLPFSAESLSVVDVVAPVTDFEGNFKGVLCAHLSWEWAKEVGDWLSALQSRSQVEILILSQNGTVLFRSPKLQGLQMKPKSFDVERYSDRYLIETWADGKTYITGFARSQGYLNYPGLGWVVLVRQKTDVAFAPARQLQQQILIGDMVFGLVLAIFGCIMAGKIVDPILAIASALHRIRLGDKTVQIPVRQGNDEIGLLWQSLSQLLQKVTEQENQLVASNQLLHLELSDRAKAEVLLQQSEEHLRLALEAARIGIWDWNILTDKITWSDNYALLFGLEPGTFNGTYEAFNEWVHPEDRESITQALNRCVKAKAEYEQEFRVIWRDRSIHWIEAKGQFFYDSSGFQAVRMVGTVMDITQRKQTESNLQKAKDELEFKAIERNEELSQANEKLQLELFERQRTQKMLQDQAQLLDLAHDAILTLDLNFNVTFWNRGAEKMYGWTKQEALGKESHKLLQTQFPKGLPEIQTKLLREGCWEGELIQTKRDGTTIVVTSRWAIQRDLHGTPIKILEINSNITATKRSEDALITSGVRLAGILDIAEDAIISVNQSQQITLFNQGAEKIFGYTANEVLGKPLSLLLPERFADAHPQDLAQFFQSESVARKIGDRREIIGYRKNGTEFPAEASISQLELGSEKISTVILRDITERKASEEALQEANTELRSWVKELESRNREIALLGEMSDILQTCLSIEEAYSAIAGLVQPLFPNFSGGVFVINSSKQIVEAVATWGDSTFTSQLLFTPNECWALRRGRSHLFECDHRGLHCKHRLGIGIDRARRTNTEENYSQSPIPPASLCVPMMAQGEALGVLYLSSQALGQFTQAKQQLATTVAEHIGLALANLKLHEALKQQSIRDTLTGLFNRRYLEESLEREINRAERKQQSLGIIMIDVDHFKRFNDTFGHEAGDTVLRELGVFLRSHTRGSDIACRYGGEELTLILPEASLEATRERAEAIREGVKHLNLQNRRQSLGSITLSIGVAIFPTHGLTGSAVIRAADAALYHAKHQGRDRVLVAS
ncbi:diguanylate cyclase [Funiculus sociatus GB2-A5]|uniref:Diguanylate cyclase n=1 Tax=Funiculus sociatus GB2-A5 TaxID=2933946 RepID=A0ABV0JRR1_9CYAN|nr:MULTISPECIES: diguanylate cyclase [unclassified Trichocoleus]MBD1904339.1 diguanylate cyclase [Trichocoleus sp. FACHB-832]MBD2065010.1 diguanylate cyclase [Trichocoleus sp. FACHB-6]